MMFWERKNCILIVLYQLCFRGLISGIIGYTQPPHSAFNCIRNFNVINLNSIIIKNIKNAINTALANISTKKMYLYLTD